MKMKVYKTITSLEDLRYHKEFLKKRNKKREDKLQSRLNELNEGMSMETVVSGIGSTISSSFVHFLPNILSSFMQDGQWGANTMRFLGNKKRWLWVAIGVATVSIATYYAVKRARTHADEPKG